MAETIARRFGCGFAVVSDRPSLVGHDLVIIVVPNTGDEELPEPMEEFLFDLTETGKRYAVCELGNYFGFESYCGCKKVVFSVLDGLGWHRVGDVSLDSLPTLDRDGLERWLDGQSNMWNRETLLRSSDSYSLSPSADMDT